MFVHDLIKIRMSVLGYLANLPYHLISDKEMFEGFLPELFYPNVFPEVLPGWEGQAKELFAEKPWLISGGFFTTYYPDFPKTPTGEYPSIHYEYLELKSNIMSCIRDYLSDGTAIPDWVYAYMLGEVIGVQSDKRDIHDLISALGTDNIDDDYTIECAEACYAESLSWITRTSLSKTRCATMFGEPHVIKSLRLKQAAPIK